MSSLWTPDGEHPVGRPRPEAAAPPPTAAGTPGTGPEPSDSAGEAGTSGAAEEDLAAVRQQLARTPAALVVANHVFGLFELAALHLSLTPPQLDEARLAIDAAAALVDGLAGQLGEAEPTARDGLAQLRLAFVEIKAAAGG